MNSSPATPLPARRIEVYDTTLRDGTQGVGVALTLVDKLRITTLLDDLGFDYIEGGYPLSNPKDAAYFEQARTLPLKHAKVVAFGMTRRKAITPAEDEGMRALVASLAPVITIVGKTWDLHVDEVLRVGRDENLAMIRESIAYCTQQPHVEQVFYDAEHFFDGYRANPAYALSTLRAAVEGGATRLVLCDTNGGTMPDFITRAVTDVQQHLGLQLSQTSTVALGIHTHNDAGLAVANSLAALQAGAVQVQGTINGIGERCGNVDLITVVANLQLKLGHDCLAPGALPKLTRLSRDIDEIAQLRPQHGQPYVGQNAFAHKGGMHVHAVNRIAHSYEHTPPDAVGNQRIVVVSELAGASNIAATIGHKFHLENNRAAQRQLLEKVQDLEHAGYQFDQALASLELLAYEATGTNTRYWALDHYRCVILKTPDQPTSTEAIVKLRVGDKTPEHRVAEGDGPVNALDGALRKSLKDHYPIIRDLHLVDYTVRVVNPTAESAAKVRVVIEFESRHGTTRRFRTVGVNENIIDASWQALADGLRYHLTEAGIATP